MATAKNGKGNRVYIGLVTECQASHLIMSGDVTHLFLHMRGDHFVLCSNLDGLMLVKSASRHVGECLECHVGKYEAAIRMACLHLCQYLPRELVADIVPGRDRVDASSGLVRMDGLSWKPVAMSPDRWWRLRHHPTLFKVTSELMRYMVVPTWSSVFFSNYMDTQREVQANLRRILSLCASLWWPTSSASCHDDVKWWHGVDRIMTKYYVRGGNMENLLLRLHVEFRMKVMQMDCCTCALDWHFRHELLRAVGNPDMSYLFEVTDIVSRMWTGSVRTVRTRNKRAFVRMVESLADRAKNVLDMRQKKRTWRRCDGAMDVDWVRFCLVAARRAGVDTDDEMYSLVMETPRQQYSIN